MKKILFGCYAVFIIAACAFTEAKFNAVKLNSQPLNGTDTIPPGNYKDRNSDSGGSNKTKTHMIKHKKYMDSTNSSLNHDTTKM